jgi:FKBP-type peptidyl-prolyl cis-trans isomerase (trigger factor)
MSMEQFLMLSQKTEAEYKKEMEPEATRHVKVDLLLEAIADEEGLAASDRELQELLDLYNQIGAAKTPRLNQLSTTVRKRLENSIKRDKARKFLIEHATSTPEQKDDDSPAAEAAIEASESLPVEEPETSQASS